MRSLEQFLRGNFEISSFIRQSRAMSVVIGGNIDQLNTSRKLGPLTKVHIHLPGVLSFSLFCLGLLFSWVIGGLFAVT